MAHGKVKSPSEMAPSCGPALHYMLSLEPHLAHASTLKLPKADVHVIAVLSAPSLDLVLKIEQSIISPSEYGRCSSGEIQGRDRLEGYFIHAWA